MRFRVHIDQEVMQRLYSFVRARRKLCQRRILEREVTLSHRALHGGYGVTHYACKSGMRLGLVNQLAYRGVEHAAKQQRRIMATGAPFRWPHAYNVLHVFDALAI